MTKFLDGPAAGQSLLLKRSPNLLRVISHGDGTFDALDQPEDTLRQDEFFVTVYVLHKHIGNCHIRASKGRSGFYPIVEYKMFHVQPLDSVMRNNEEWVRWCDWIRTHPNPNAITPTY